MPRNSMIKGYSETRSILGPPTRRIYHLLTFLYEPCHGSPEDLSASYHRGFEEDSRRIAQYRKKTAAICVIEKGGQTFVVKSGFYNKIQTLFRCLNHTERQDQVMTLDRDLSHLHSYPCGRPCRRQLKDVFLNHLTYFNINKFLY